MSGNSNAALRAFAFVCLQLLLAAAGQAQCDSASVNLHGAVGPDIPGIPQPLPDNQKPPEPATDDKPLEPPILPEAGFLSDTHYTSQFFGFSFDLPLTVRGHEIMMAVMPVRQHALLALQYEDGAHKGYIMITADDPRPGYEINTPEKTAQEMREWQQANAQLGQPQVPIPDFLLRTSRFYHQFQHRGKNYSAQYWAGFNNYLVKIVVRTNDAEFLRKAKDDMSRAQFYCRKDDGTLATEDGKPAKVEGEPYSGPTVPTFLVNAALHDEPARDINRGKVTDGFYRNPDIGVEYRLPKGWVQTSVDMSDAPMDEDALREYQFLHACEQMLLQIAPQNAPARSDNLKPLIVLRALDPNCLDLHTATSLTDKHTLDAVAATLEEFGEFGQVGSDELKTISGHLFMIFHGTIPASGRSEDLSHRLSQTIYATRYHKMLLMWSFMAPTTAALDQLPTGGVAFADAPPIELGTSNRTVAGR